MLGEKEGAPWPHQKHSLPPSNWLLLAEIKAAVLNRGELKDLFIPEFKQTYCWLKRYNYFPFASSSHPGSLNRVSFNRATATLAASLTRSPCLHLPHGQTFSFQGLGAFECFCLQVFPFHQCGLITGVSNVGT